MIPATEVQVYTVHPGGVALATRGDRLETLLGSCVAVILTDPRRTVAAMCHIVHAGGTGRGPGSATGLPPTAHAETALERLSELLVAQGITPGLCEAYVYGGGDQFPHLEDRLGVGRRNVDHALAWLSARGLRIVETDTHGSVYRRVRWTVGPTTPVVERMPL